jgi:hypothetical protein
MPRTATAPVKQTVINVGTVADTSAAPARTARTKQPSARPNLAVVKPSAKPATPAETTAQVTETTAASKGDVRKREALENTASRLLHASVVRSTELAETLVQLYPYAPWKAHGMSVKDYFKGLGIHEANYTMPKPARQRLVSLMYADGATPPILDVAAMAGAGERSIKRDRDELGFANPNRQAGQKSGDDSNADGNADGDSLTVGTGSVDPKPTAKQIDTILDKLDAVAPYLTDEQRAAVITLMQISGE